jgi:UDP:flavonoid glycosyltransferase YjiC (YdhE family)
LSITGRKKVLCIWGQGGGYGHAARMLSIADALDRDGHEVHLALRDRQAIKAIAGEYRGSISDCPVYRPTMQLERHQASLADLLLLSGFADNSVLASLLDAWRSLVTLCDPDFIIADHAPAALLVAYQLGIPASVTGNPFVNPAPGHPLADWRPDAPADNLVSRTEALVLRNINGLACLSGRPLTRVSDLFSCLRTILTCYPVLDAGRDQRKDTDYCAANLVVRDTKTDVPPL